MTSAKWPLALGVLMLGAALASCGSGDSGAPPSTDPAPPLAGNPTDGTGAAPPAQQVCLGYERVFSAVPLDLPVALAQAPGDPSRWFAVERAGRIVHFANDATAAQAASFIDIADKVDTYFEGGLLGMAFHPDFGRNRYVYLSYTSSDGAAVESGSGFRSVLSRFTATSDGLTLLPDSEWPLLTLAQPYGNHNGGQVAFGPDGYLYFGLGDGGSAGDPKNHGQDTRTLFGAMLRLDVNISENDLAAGLRYRIPPHQPFAGEPICRNGLCPDMEADKCAAPGCAEIFAWGLRNPWRWSFDRETSALWVADVGQNAREEIDLVKVGDNLGWSCAEGNAPYKPERCASDAALVAPVVDYPHPLLGSASITGGYVYRGKAIPALRGTYLYADFSSGGLFALVDAYGARLKQPILETGNPIVSFGEDADGELHFLSLYNPSAVYRIVANSPDSGGNCLAVGAAAP